jgi:hypothetical protein
MPHHEKSHGGSANHKTGNQSQKSLRHDIHPLWWDLVGKQCG